MKRIILILMTPIIALSIIFLLLPKLEIPPLSSVLLDHSGEILCTNLSVDEKWRLPISLGEVPPLYLKMLIAYEDKRFYQHPGVDPFALARGLWQWIKNRRIISGGSTLTMQTVRLLNPRPRTLYYKVEEVFQTLYLECRYKKNEILTMYLTLAPYGGNIEGLRAASLSYFDQDPIQLTPAKMALLVVIPQSPTALRPHIYPHKAKAFRDKVLIRLREKGILTAKQSRESILDPVVISRTPFPRFAPHVMSIFRKKYPSQAVYKTTLQKKKQIALESLLHAQMVYFAPQQTAAALIVENKSRTIVAYVGSADPWREEKNGYVDMIQAVRSPGSTLKPLIYALAFDENLIHPETLIDDVPTNFGGYTPTNFRDVFHGKITIREALQQSLNIPVVHLLDRLGPGRFVNWLREYNVALSFSPKDRPPSLPIALGGVGIRLEDLVSLYCALANEEKYASLTIEPRTKPLRTMPFVQEASSWYVTNILEGAPAPRGHVDWFVTEKTPVAFKTGTSYGARDALCVGYSVDGYTVGVWTGRADGSPSPNQLGRRTAAPIFLKIFNTILLPKRRFSQAAPPESVLLVSGAQLPRALRSFRHVGASFVFRSHGSLLKQSVPLKIISPLTNATYSLQKRNSNTSMFVPIPLKVKGGKPPYLFLVNGEVIKDSMLIEHGKNNMNHEGCLLWNPTKRGFFELTLIDAEGHSDSVTIRLRQ